MKSYYWRRLKFTISLCLVLVLMVLQINVIASIADHEDNKKVYSGIVFIDDNGDGILDEGEKRLKDIEVILYTACKETYLDADTLVLEYKPVEYNSTNKNGVFEFDNISISRVKISLNEDSVLDKYEIVKNTIDDNGKEIILFALTRKVANKSKTLVERISDEDLSSFQKIEIAFNEGFIDKDTKTTYLVKALLNDVSLPAVFKSNKKMELDENLKYIKQYIADNRNNPELEHEILLIEQQIQLLSSVSYDGYLETTHFRIFYNKTTGNDHCLQDGLGDSNSNQIPDKVDDIGIDLEATYSKVTGDTSSGNYGFNEPEVASTLDRIDVFIYETNYNGLCAPVECMSLNPKVYAAELTLDVELTASGQELELEKTIAHEFFHAVQYAYNYDAEVWWMEATADYMAEKIAPGSYAVQARIGSYLSNCDLPFDDTTNSLHKYGVSLFAFHLDEDWGGVSTIRDTWNRLGTSGQNYNEPYSAIDYTITNNYPNEDLDSLFIEFAGKNYNCPQYYTFDSNYNGTWNETHGKFNTFSTYSGTNSDTVPYMSTNYDVFQPTASASRLLELNFDGEDNYSWGIYLFKDNSASTIRQQYTPSSSNNKIDVLVYDFGSTYTQVGVGIYNADWDSQDSMSYSLSYDEHTLGNWYTTTAANCQFTGIERRDCTDTGCSYYEERVIPVDPSAHVWGPLHILTEATCVSSGEKHKHCTVSGCSETSTPVSYTDWNNHDWGPLHILTTATCISSGTMHRHCERTGCNDTSTPVSYTEWDNHNVGSWETVVSPTCSQTGVEKKFCTRCDIEMDSRSIPMLPHTWPSSWTETQAPTCTLNGIEVKRCTVCSTLLASQSIPMTGHTWEAEIYSSAKTSSTCPYRRYTYDYQCSVCSTWQGNQWTSDIYEGHNLGAWTFWYDYWDDMLMQWVDVYRKDCSVCTYYDWEERY